MNGSDTMSDALELSEAKRALLERYLHGDLPRAAKADCANVGPAKTEATDQPVGVVPIQIGWSKRPFFYLHGDWGGKAFYCYPLAHELGADQPFYVVEPYRFDGLPVPPTFEAMAEAHLKSLRAVQPEGPYLLGGFCSGGLVAYEMARLLHGQGQKVDLLVLMDPDPPAPALDSLVRGVIRRICDPLRIGQEKQLDWFLLYAHLRSLFRIGSRMRSLSRKLAEAALPPSYWRLKDFKRLEATKQSGLSHRRGKVGFALPTPDWVVPTTEVLRQQRIFHWISADYTPGLYPGKITFFWSEDPFFRVRWRKVVEAKANEAEVHFILGNHITSRTEHLSSLAEHLRNCVNKVQEPMLR
jgi:hypothetical protein